MKTFIVIKSNIAFLALMSYSTLVFSESEVIGYSPDCKISDYPPSESSEYILPYPAGEKYYISQGNCGLLSHMQNYSMGIDMRYAYDFKMPIGSKVIAARSGIVINTEDFYSNNTTKYEETNLVGIKHVDGTVALYFHFSPKGVLVNIGDKVSRGDLIGISGSSGMTGNSSHLHFEVRERESENCDLSGYKSTDPKTHTKFSECKSIPISFKNAEPMDVPLRVRKTYKASRFDPE